MLSLSAKPKTITLRIQNPWPHATDSTIYERMFDRFYKADKSRGLDKTGVGLGLFIVKAILQAHGEDISVKSEEGKNCSFMLTLPKGTDPNASKNAKRNREN